MCRCAERRTAILRGAEALAKGDAATLTEAASFVVRTSAADLRQVTQTKLAAAHARLRRR